MEPVHRGASWTGRTAHVLVALVAALVAVLIPGPTLAAPGDPGPGGLAAARAEAARLQREVARLDVKVEILAEAHSAAQAKLDGLIQAAHRHQVALERSELKLQETRAEYAGDVRDLYARGPLAPLELLLAAGDIHELAVATDVAGADGGRGGPVRGGGVGQVSEPERPDLGPWRWRAWPCGWPAAARWSPPGWPGARAGRECRPGSRRARPPRPGRSRCQPDAGQRLEIAVEHPAALAQIGKPYRWGRPARHRSTARA